MGKIHGMFDSRGELFYDEAITQLSHIYAVEYLARQVIYMLNVLIVEDEEAIANLIHASLKDEGYACQRAFNGKQAADLIEQNQYDLVLLDILLPEIDGYELLEYIRPTGTPVIFITAKGNLNERIKGLLISVPIV